jgi:hypothetical protein
MLRYLDNVENKRQINENLSRELRIIYYRITTILKKINGAKGRFKPEKTGMYRKFQEDNQSNLSKTGNFKANTLLT